MQTISFSKNRFLQMMIVLYAGLWIWLAVEPYSRYDWVLENLLIWAALIGLVSTYKFFHSQICLMHGLLCSWCCIRLELIIRITRIGWMFG